MKPVTEIRIDERGDETHESWVQIRANRVSGNASLFDSEIKHQHFIVVEVHRVTRRRELNRDWIAEREQLIGLAMSEAQWGGFVSSFATSGVPATLEFLTGVGHVPSAPVKSRLDESHKEVREAGTRAVEKVRVSYDALVEAFETGGKKAQREALRDLGIRIDHVPANMEFAASSLTEHVENVVARARADIEAMVLRAAERGELAEPSEVIEIGSGEAEVVE